MTGIPTILLHGVWMDNYNGHEDPPSFYAGNFSWPKKKGWSHEMYNFKEINDNCYGHVQHSGKDLIDFQIKIENLGAGSADHIEGVRVIWTAPKRRTQGKVIVGWYNNATVYRHPQTMPPLLAHERQYAGEQFTYRVIAASSDCHLLPNDKRIVHIPVSKIKNSGFPGAQSKVFYLKDDNKNSRKTLDAIDELISGKQPLSLAPKKKKTKAKVDVEKRKEIEEKAVKLVTTYFEDLGYTVESREDENVGYDLYAFSGDAELCIEVKGRSIPQVVADFSFNEYDTIKAYEKGKFDDGEYRIFIVTDTLGANPKLHHFEYIDESNFWFCKNPRMKLNPKVREALRMTGEEM